ncbi:MAG: xylose isomerase [Planctomycetaceae bacterium]|nr:xylose isomerase [Planctomycetaceae bacterium]
MAKARIGAQTYTIREQCEKASDVAGCCAKIKAMGYDGIQASAAGFSAIDARELKKILDGEGLACASTHIGYDRMRDETDTVIEDHQILNCKYPAIGGLFLDTLNADVIRQFAADFSAVGRKFAAADMRIGYHNHSHELMHFDGTPMMQMLIDAFDPSVWFEIDVYWIAHGLGDPAEWIGKVAGRIPCVHYKDGRMNAERQHLMCEIGAGNLNWPRINAACVEAGAEWLLVERDSGELDPFESLKISLENMRAMGL